MVLDGQIDGLLRLQNLIYDIGSDYPLLFGEPGVGKDQVIQFI